MKQARVRLYVDHPLGQGQTVPVAGAQSHYLFTVMRLRPGDAVTLFNGRDGEFPAEVTEAGKRGGTLVCGARTRAMQMPPDLWLVFAPVKKARTDFIVEKAVEMGARHILPVRTDFTNSERLRVDRLQVHAVEAAEQCGATFVPEVAEMQPLDRLLDSWAPDRHIMFCDEALAGASSDLSAHLDERGRPDRHAPWAVLIGPEGGFSDAERARLRTMGQAHPVSLGPRILRADTAAVAALTLWQAALGDWT